MLLKSLLAISEIYEGVESSIFSKRINFYDEKKLFYVTNTDFNPICTTDAFDRFNISTIIGFVQCYKKFFTYNCTLTDLPPSFNTEIFTSYIDNLYQQHKKFMTKFAHGKIYERYINFKLDTDIKLRLLFSHVPVLEEDSSKKFTVIPEFFPSTDWFFKFLTYCQIIYDNAGTMIASEEVLSNFSYLITKKIKIVQDISARNLLIYTGCFVSDNNKAELFNGKFCVPFRVFKTSLIRKTMSIENRWNFCHVFDRNLRPVVSELELQKKNRIIKSTTTAISDKRKRIYKNPKQSRKIDYLSESVSSVDTNNFQHCDSLGSYDSRIDSIELPPSDMKSNMADNFTRHMPDIPYDQSDFAINYSDTDDLDFKENITSGTPLSISPITQISSNICPAMNLQGNLNIYTPFNTTNNPKISSIQLSKNSDITIGVLTNSQLNTSECNYGTKLNLPSNMSDSNSNWLNKIIHTTPSLQQYSDHLLSFEFLKTDFVECNRTEISAALKTLMKIDAETANFIFTILQRKSQR